ncbi:MAG TPA: O-antigen ligase family protein [Methylomirabilota bacterium]
MLPAAFALIVWGTLAFGAVYDWAYTPLATGAALVGLGALLQAVRRGRLHASDGLLLSMLALIALGALLQVVPLPRSVRLAVSPATEVYFREHDPVYRLAYEARRSSAAVLGLLAPAGLPPRPLSLNTGATLRAVGLLIAFALLLAGLIRTFHRTGIRRFARWLIAFGVLVALIGIVQKAVLGDHAFGGMKIYGFWEPTYKLTTPFGPFVNKNHFAGWMLLVLPLALGYFAGLAEDGIRRGAGWRERLLWLSSEGGGQAQLLAIAIAVMTLSLLMTLSRSGVAGLAVAVAITTLTAAGTLASVRARLGLVASLVLLMAIVVQWSSVNLSARFDSVPEAVALRVHAWRDAASIIRDFPLTGTGLNTYGAATLKYQTGDRTLHFREAHNDYLQVAAEGGLLLGLPAAVALFAFARLVWRRFRAAEDDRLTYWVRVGAVTGLVAIAVQSFVEFSLQMPGIACLAVTLAAMAAHPARPAHRQVTPTMSRMPRPPLAGYRSF